MKKKYVLIAISIVISIGIYNLSIDSRKTFLEENVTVINTKENEIITEKKFKEQYTPEKIENIPPAISTWPAEDFAEFSEWIRSRGNMGGNPDNEYKSYNMETLEKLSDTGDIHAMHALAALYLNEENATLYGFKAAEPLYWKAAVYGSTDALMQLAVINNSKYIVGGHSEEKKRSEALNSLAFFKAAELRGDRYVFLMAGKHIISSNKLLLTASDHQYIDQKGTEIYAYLAQQREELSLDEFDNSTPESVKRMIKKLENH